MISSETDALAQLILQFRRFAASRLPVLENEVNDIIARKETDGGSIELLLDILLSMLNIGIGRELFYRLHQYYKNIDHWRFVVYQVLAAELTGSMR